jgi:hypothetical protein
MDKQELAQMMEQMLARMDANTKTMLAGLTCHNIILNV